MLARRQCAQIDAVEHDPAGRRLDQPKQAAAGRGLAGAGFADQADDGAALHVEADAIDRLHDAARGRGSAWYSPSTTSRRVSALIGPRASSSG